MKRSGVPVKGDSKSTGNLDQSRMVQKGSVQCCKGLDAWDPDTILTPYPL